MFWGPQYDLLLFLEKLGFWGLGDTRSSGELRRLLGARGFNRHSLPLVLRQKKSGPLNPAFGFL